MSAVSYPRIHPSILTITYLICPSVLSSSHSSVYLPLYLSPIHPSIHSSVRPFSACLPAYPPVCLSLFLLICPSSYLSVHPSVLPSTSIYILQSIHPYTLPSRSACMSICIHAAWSMHRINIHSATPEIPRLLQKIKSYYRVHKIRPQDLILNQINPVFTPSSQYLWNQFTIT